MRVGVGVRVRVRVRVEVGWLVILSLVATVGSRALRSLVITPRSSTRTQVLRPRGVWSLVIPPALLIGPSRAMRSLAIPPGAAGPRRLARLGIIPLVITPLVGGAPLVHPPWARVRVRARVRARVGARARARVRVRVRVRVRARVRARVSLRN